MSTLQPQHFRKVRAGDYALAYPPEGSVAAKQPERALLFRLAKNGRTDERKFTFANRQIIKQLDSMKLAFRAKNFCQLTEHGVAVFNHLNFATQGVQL